MHRCLLENAEYRSTLKKTRGQSPSFSHPDLGGCCQGPRLGPRPEQALEGSWTMHRRKLSSRIAFDNPRPL